MVNLEITRRRHPDSLEIHTISDDQIDRILSIIGKLREPEDYFFPKERETNDPVYLTPYGQRIFITAEGELIFDCFGEVEEHTLCNYEEIYKEIKNLIGEK